MFFRFAAALMLVVAVSMAQVGLEKQSLSLRRKVSRQYYQLDELLELHAQLRLDIQKMSAPSQFVAQRVQPTSRSHAPSSQPASMERHRTERSSSRLPVMRWRLPVRPDGAVR